MRQLGPMAGTLMAVDPDAPRVALFVVVGGEPYLIRYNKPPARGGVCARGRGSALPGVERRA